jgi:hypothetical protein
VDDNGGGAIYANHLFINDLLQTRDQMFLHHNTRT